VAEYFNHQVSVFVYLWIALDQRGQVVSYIEGVALSSDGNVYVSNNGNHRIQVYKYYLHSPIL